MIAPERLARLDADLDALGVPAERVEAALDKARRAHLSLEEADAALASLAERFETRVPDGALARSGSWERAPREPRPMVAPLEPVSPADESKLPPVLSERPPSSDGFRISVEVERVEPAAAEVATVEEQRAEVQTAEMAAYEPITEERPSIEISIEPSASDPAPGLAASSLFDDDDGAVGHGGSELAQAEAALIAAAANVRVGSALELELDAEPATRPREQSSAKFAVPKDSAHPSPKSVVPAPSSAELEADLASILADELEPPVAEPSELESESTALFSADMFGAADEPSLAELVSRPPPPDGADDVEIDIDDDVLVYDAEASAAAPPPLPATGTRPPPGRSAPPAPPAPGFLGRLLNRKG